MRFEKPHSLSYQAKTLANLSPRTFVIVASKMLEAGFPMKSFETSSSSVYWRKPWSGALAARLLQRRVDGLDRDGFVRREREVHERNVDRRHPDRQAVELTLELRNDLADGLRRAGARRDHADGSGARTPEILVRQIQQILVVRVGVDRGHQPTLDAEGIEHHLGDGREAVRRARTVRDDVVLRGVVLMVVDAHHDGEVLALRWGADDDLLRACREMSLGFCALREEARALEHHVHPEALPRELLRIADGRDLNVLAADADGLVSWFDACGPEGAVDAVVFQEVGEGLRVREVVDGDDLDVRHLPLVERAEDTASNPSEAVDADLDCHDSFVAPCATRNAKTCRFTLRAAGT